MRNKLKILTLLIIIGAGSAILAYSFKTSNKATNTSLADVENLSEENLGGLEESPNPLSIESLRLGNYPGSDIEIEQDLGVEGNYKKYIASYRSEGLRIYALLTVPQGNPPPAGWPAIIFNHGYIPPSQYQTTERYAAYVSDFARNGYVVLKPDFRGHGNSEGEPTGAYGSAGYTIDVLNAVASIKKFNNVNKDKIGMWGHSMGGYITLRNMVIAKDIKVGVIWAGVTGSYPDMLNNWRRRITTPSPTFPTSRRWRQEFVEKYGTPEQNPQFWNSISANAYLNDISGPLQLHHGTGDASVPVSFSEKLAQDLQKQGKSAEIFTYPGDDHNLNANFGTAMQRSVKFFDRFLK